MRCSAWGESGRWETPPRRFNHAVVGDNGNRTMPKILLIDDQDSVRTVLRIALERDGYDVEEAVNGRQGLALYGKQPADLVITDITMPEMNGLDLMVELARQFVNVKVIAMSGEINVLAVAKQLGARETLQKPFEIDTFLGIVRDELAH